MATPVWQIYKLSFPDRFWYVGQTKVGVKKRMWDHRSKKTRVGKRLLAGETPKIQILTTALTQEEADTLELEWMARFPQGYKLNGNPIRVRQATAAPPQDGCYLCSWCRRWTPVKNMTPWKGRRRGYDYKCLPCYRAYKRVALYRGNPGGNRKYQLAYRLVRGWVLAGKNPEWLFSANLALTNWEIISSSPHYFDLQKNIPQVLPLDKLIPPGWKWCIACGQKKPYNNSSNFRWCGECYRAYSRYGYQVRKKGERVKVRNVIPLLRQRVEI